MLDEATEVVMSENNYPADQRADVRSFLVDSGLTFIKHLEIRAAQGWTLGRGGGNGAPIQNVFVFLVWAIEAGIIFAKTQGGHGSERRTGEIMKSLMTYGAAAKSAIPGLKELIVALNDQCKAGEFPGGELNQRRVSAVENAIKFIESATDQPELRSIGPVKAVQTSALPFKKL